MTGSTTTTTARTTRVTDNDKRGEILSQSLYSLAYPTLLNYTLQILNSQLSRTPINPNWIWHKDKTTASIAPTSASQCCRAICPKATLPLATPLPTVLPSQMCRLTIFSAWQAGPTPLNGLHLRSQPATWYKQISHFYVTLCLKYFTFFAAILSSFSSLIRSYSTCWHYISTRRAPTNRQIPPWLKKTVGSWAMTLL